MIKAALSSPPSQTANSRTLSPVVSVTLLLLCGAGSLWLYHWARDLHRFIQGISGYTALFIAQFALYLLACYLATRRQPFTTRRTTLFFAVIVLLFAALFRFDLVAQRPYLSTDVYRYVWDGRVQAAGINPYRYPPSAPELAELRDTKIFPYINRSDSTNTPYPPGAQLIFLLAYLMNPSSVIGFKVLMTLLDLLAIIAVMLTLHRVGRTPAQAVIFAWHPLLIYEGAHTGHVESAFIVFLALALLARSYKKPVFTGVALAFATLIKYYPAMLLPIFLFTAANAEEKTSEEKIQQASVDACTTRQPSGRKFDLAAIGKLINAANLKLLAAFVITIALTYLPYLTIGTGTVGSLANEFNEEGFTGTGRRYFLLVLARTVVPVPTTLFLFIAAFALVGFAAYWMMKPKPDAVAVACGALALIGLYFFLVTPRYHWYYAWILPFLCFAPRLSWLYLTGASVLLYALWFTPLIYPEIPIWLGLAIYAPTLGFLGWEQYKKFSSARR